MMSTPVKIISVVVLAAAVVGAGFLGSATANMQRAATQPALQSPAQPAQPAPQPPPRPARPGAPRPRFPFAPGNRGPWLPGYRGFDQYGRRGPRFGGAWGGPRNPVINKQVQSALATALGMTPAELRAALSQGETPQQIARQKGISPQDFRSKFSDALSTQLKQAVASGSLTQAQADAILAQVRRGFIPGRLGWGNRPPTRRENTPWGWFNR